MMMIFSLVVGRAEKEGYHALLEDQHYAHLFREINSKREECGVIFGKERISPPEVIYHNNLFQ